MVSRASMASENGEGDDEAYERLRKSRKLGLCQKLSSQYRACYLEGLTPYERAQKLDGGYFEKFTALDWKEEGKGNEEENKKIESLPELQDLESIEEGAGVSQEVVSSHETKATLTVNQREALFCEVLYTVMHQLGAQGKTRQLSSGDLHVYAQEVLNISEERHRELYAKTKERQPPAFYLKVTVVEARKLEAKDANGLSDPYCMLGLMRMELEDELEQDTKKKRGKLKKTKTLRDILKNEAIKVSTVRENTLNPSWNETFTLEVTDAHHEKLHVDIWDCDDKEMLTDKDNKITKIKGLQGVGRYFKDVVQSARASDNESIDDFLGYFEIPVKNIPVDGVDLWFTLQTRSSKCRVSGECHVKVTLSSGQRPDLPASVRSMYPTFSEIYGALLHEVIAYDVDQAKLNTEEHKWSGHLSKHAQYILHQLAIQNDMTSLQEAAMRWRFYSDRHWHDPLQYDMLCSLAHDVTRLWTPNKLAPREERPLLKSLREFVDNCFELLLKHRDLYSPTESARFGRLINLIECQRAVCAMDIYQEEKHEPLRITLTNMLKESASSWYRNTCAWKEPRQASEEGRLTSMVEVAECVVTDLLKGHKFYRKVFFLVGVDYFTISYNQLELMLASDVHNTMKSVNKRIKQEGNGDIVGEKLFALYLAVKEIIGYREHLTPSAEHVFALDDFYEWFSQSVTRWFDIAETKAKERIKKAIAVDKFLRIDPSVMHSTSAVDTAGCFYQIQQFWKKLDWPDPVGSYVFITQLTNIICTGASCYADLLFEKMIERNYYDNDPTQFDVSEQLCVSLNDIEHIRLWLAKLPETLGWERVIAAMTTAHGEKGGKHARVAMETVLSSADEDMQNKICTIIAHVGQMMAVDVKKFVIQLSWEQNPKPAEEAIGPLLKYLDDDLMVLNKSLMKFVFEQILEYMWEIVIESFNNMIKSSRGSPPEFYHRLDKAIEIVKIFFHADGVGLTYDQLTGGLYKSIEEILALRRMSSEELIQMYFAEKCAKQEEVEEEYGAITLRAIYDSANKKVLVEVLNARNLPPLDTNGLSDPYVLLRLIPFHFFGREERKTKVVKNTLFPLFDEQFEFSVTPEQCKTSGVCLAITVLDYDVLTNDDIEGHAFLSLDNLSGLDKPLSGGFATEPQKTLHLAHPAPQGLAFEILECRQDKLAENFVKEEKALYEKTKSAHS